MADLETLVARLQQAEAAEHSLRIGAKTVSVKVDGHEVAYSEASLNGLVTYIARLRSEIARAGGTAAQGARPRRALRPYF